MTPAFHARRLRNIAWRMHLWQQTFFFCCLLPSDYTLVSAALSRQESWDLLEASIDTQVLFLLFVAEAIEQGDI